MDKQPTVLNVEDVRENRDLVRRILQSQGYRVVDAVNAMQGIEKAKAVRPDLILMDINLPDLDGFSAVTRIRSFPNMGNVPILALTARTVADDRARAKAIGCDHYLNKPIDFDELVTQVDKYIKQGRPKSQTDSNREKYLLEQNVNLIEELENKISELEAANSHLKQREKDLEKANQELREREHELEEANEYLAQSKENQTRFISVMAHELRTPLTVVDGSVQMLKLLIPDNENAQELMETIKNGVGRLKVIFDDMVSVIRDELSDMQKDFVPVSIRTVIKAAQAEHEAVAEERNIELKRECVEELPFVNGDSHKLQDALSRIVGNAIKYTPDGGEVIMRARHISEASDGDTQVFVEVVIEDTGVGIDLDKQQLIFQKFGTAAADISLHSTSKTKFMGGGTGLGLPIAKGIIESHGGRIWVESSGFDQEALPGSKFYILLPAQFEKD